jgi:NADH dehydrogenase [ubiquinone] 1 alpha subcomplex assembly factor 6
MRRIVDARVCLYRFILPELTPRLVSPQQTEELKGASQLTMESLTAHAEATASTHHYLLLSLLGISSDTLSHAASHLGIAHCISTLLRALPYHASKGRMVIPAEITAKHGVSQEDVFRRGSAAKGIENAVFEFATIANDHMITARDMFKEDSGKVPRNAMPVFGAGASGGLMTDTVDATNFDNRCPSRHFWRGWRQ